MTAEKGRGLLSKMGRRVFVKWAAAGLAVVPALGFLFRFVRRGRPSAKEEAESFATRHLADLEVLAAILLPSRLGPADTRRIAAQFVGWIGGQSEEPELSWGTNIWTAERLKTRGPEAKGARITTAAYEKWLIDARRELSAQDLARAPRAKVEALVRRELEARRGTGLPRHPEGKSPVVDLLSFFYNRPEAFNLLHLRAIHQTTCRGLGQVSEPPPRI